MTRWLDCKLARILQNAPLLKKPRKIDLSCEINFSNFSSRYFRFPWISNVPRSVALSDTSVWSWNQRGCVVVAELIHLTFSMNCFGGVQVKRKICVQNLSHRKPLLQVKWSYFFLVYTAQKKIMSICSIKSSVMKLLARCWNKVRYCLNCYKLLVFSYALI